MMLYVNNHDFDLTIVPTLKSYIGSIVPACHFEFQNLGGKKVCHKIGLDFCTNKSHLDNKKQKKGSDNQKLFSMRSFVKYTVQEKVPPSGN